MQIILWDREFPEFPNLALSQLSDPTARDTERALACQRAEDVGDTGKEARSD